mmetsp:Transcript_19323/g.41791  ORF Transcript_19323/g.41791 Transcript_19323/m.41791 type:complete len:133 (-) Transcript_19323:1102-1500(-)
MHKQHTQAAAQMAPVPRPLQAACPLRAQHNPLVPELPWSLHACRGHRPWKGLDHPCQRQGAASNIPCELYMSGFRRKGRQRIETYNRTHLTPPVPNLPTRPRLLGRSRYHHRQEGLGLGQRPLHTQRCTHWL